MLGSIRWWIKALLFLNIQDHWAGSKRDGPAASGWFLPNFWRPLHPVQGSCSWHKIKQGWSKQLLFIIYSSNSSAGKTTLWSYQLQGGLLCRRLFTCSIILRCLKRKQKDYGRLIKPLSSLIWIQQKSTIYSGRLNSWTIVLVAHDC